MFPADPKLNPKELPEFPFFKDLLHGSMSLLIHISAHLNRSEVQMETEINVTQLFHASDAAQFLGMSVANLKKLCREGKIRHLRTRKGVRLFCLEDLEVFNTHRQASLRQKQENIDSSVETRSQK